MLETQRTLLRRLTVEDAENFYALNADPEVLRFTGDKPFPSLDEARTFLAHYDQYEKYGVGRLAVILKDSHTFIGWCGLRYTADKNEYDIGFRFLRNFWNKGFATETAKRCLDHGFVTLDLPCIIGRAMKENTASVKVLEKIGMNLRNSFDFNGSEGVIYELKTPLITE